MWQIDNNTVLDTFNWSPKGVTIKDGPRAAWDKAISAYPYAEDGYNKYFDLILDMATVLFNTKIEKYDIPNKKVVIEGCKHANAMSFTEIGKSKEIPNVNAGMSTEIVKITE